MFHTPCTCEDSRPRAGPSGSQGPLGLIGRKSRACLAHASTLVAELASPRLAPVILHTCRQTLRQAPNTKPKSDLVLHLRARSPRPGRAPAAMAYTLSSLLPRHRSHRDDDRHETKSGVFLFKGEPTLFHEWEFRTLARFRATKKEDLPQLGPRVLEGLRDEAYLVAEDFGIEALCKEDAVPTLIEKMRERIFPSLAVEAKELFLQGQKTRGILSRAPGESMLQFIARRRRWWDKLKKLDPEIVISENILADLLLESANIGKQEKLMILTSVNNAMKFDPIADALVKQHPRIHVMERGGHRDPDAPRRTWSKGRGKGRRSYAHVGELDDEDDDEQESEDSYGGPEAFTGDAGEDDDAWDPDQELEELQLDVMFAFTASGDLDSEQEQVVADIAQAEAAAFMARKGAKGKGARLRKGKGKGRPYRPYKSGLSLEDRRRKLAELKSKSVCKVCGQRGHWAGDHGCPGAGKGKPEGPRPQAPKHKTRTAHVAILARSSSEPAPRFVDVAESSDSDREHYGFMASHGGSDDESMSPGSHRRHGPESHAIGTPRRDPAPGHDTVFKFGMAQRTNLVLCGGKPPRMVLLGTSAAAPVPGAARVP